MHKLSPFPGLLVLLLTPLFAARAYAVEGDDAYSRELKRLIGEWDHERFEVLIEDEWRPTPRAGSLKLTPDGNYEDTGHTVVRDVKVFNTNKGKYKFDGKHLILFRPNGAEFRRHQFVISQEKGARGKPRTVLELHVEPKSDKEWRGRYVLYKTSPQPGK